MSSKNARKYRDNMLSNSDCICDEFVSTWCSTLCEHAAKVNNWSEAYCDKSMDNACS